LGRFSMLLQTVKAGRQQRKREAKGALLLSGQEKLT